MDQIKQFVIDHPEAAIALAVAALNLVVEVMQRYGLVRAASLVASLIPHVRGVVAAVRGPKPPSVLPPGVASVLLLSLAVTGAAGTLSGCASPTAAAVVAANATRDAGEVAREVLHERCTLGYARTSDPAAIASLDRYCLPLRDAYRGLRGAHLALVTAIQSAQARGSLAALPGAVAAAAEAGELVARAVQGGER